MCAAAAVWIRLVLKFLFPEIILRIWKPVTVHHPGWNQNPMLCIVVRLHIGNIAELNPADMTDQSVPDHLFDLRFPFFKGNKRYILMQNALFLPKTDRHGIGNRRAHFQIDPIVVNAFPTMVCAHPPMLIGQMRIPQCRNPADGIIIIYPRNASNGCPVMNEYSLHIFQGFFCNPDPYFCPLRK